MISEIISLSISNMSKYLVDVLSFMTKLIELYLVVNTFKNDKVVYLFIIILFIIISVIILFAFIKISSNNKSQSKIDESGPSSFTKTIKDKKESESIKDNEESEPSLFAKSTGYY